MKIYDISQEVFGCEVYPGDDIPQMSTPCRIENGDLYNLTSFSMCAHNGTHIDAPFHFLKNGTTVDQIPLEKTVGECYVACFDGTMTVDDALNIIKTAEQLDQKAAKRILFKGNTVVTAEAAEIFAEYGVFLLGVESQSIGETGAPMAVHKILLGSKIVILEGIRLNEIESDVYFLNAVPLKLAGADGAPCRAVLIKN